MIAPAVGPPIAPISRSLRSSTRTLRGQVHSPFSRRSRPLQPADRSVHSRGPPRSRISSHAPAPESCSSVCAPSRRFLAAGLSSWPSRSRASTGAPPARVPRRARARRAPRPRDGRQRSSAQQGPPGTGGRAASCRDRPTRPSRRRSRAPAARGSTATARGDRGGCSAADPPLRRPDRHCTVSARCSLVRLRLPARPFAFGFDPRDRFLAVPAALSSSSSAWRSLSSSGHRSSTWSRSATMPEVQVVEVAHHRDVQPDAVDHHRHGVVRLELRAGAEQRAARARARWRSRRSRGGRGAAEHLDRRARGERGDGGRDEARGVGEQVRGRRPVALLGADAAARACAAAGARGSASSVGIGTIIIEPPVAERALLAPPCARTRARSRRAASLGSSPRSFSQSRSAPAHMRHDDVVDREARLVLDRLHRVERELAEGEPAVAGDRAR